MTSFNPETAENNEDIETHWAMKAYNHAETYMNLLTTIPCEKLKLTAIDQLLHQEFRKEFPSMNLEELDEMKEFKCEEAKKRWRNFIAQFEHQVEDFNFGTLLRNRAMEDYGPENSFFVPRIQFLCIEVARNREGLNASLFHNHDLKKELESRSNSDEKKEMDKEMEVIQARIAAQLDQSGK